MSYQTYTTEAIVCGSYDRMTADRTYLLFTESAGMMFATARSAREERSKQRYALQDFSHVRVSLVKGKSGWRIGSVEPLRNYYTTAPNRHARGTIVAAVQLVRRFCAGEEHVSGVFTDTVELCTAVHDGQYEPAHLLDAYTLRVLAKLGYIAPHPAYQSVLEYDTWITTADALPAEATAAIKNGLAASHL